MTTTHAIEVLGLVTARGDSKGVPRKALADLGGRPLVAWSVDAAVQSRRVTRVLTSTDSEEIAAAAREAGSDVPFLRPAELATDTSPHILTALHALDWLRDNQRYEPDYVVLLQPTSPLRTAEDIDGAVALAVEHNADAVIGVCAAKSHPMQVKAIGSDGALVDFVAGPRAAYVRRQDLAPAYAVTGAIFVNATTSLRRDQTFSPLGALPFHMSAERSIDIDTEWDLEIARAIVAASRTHR
jgi:CMP-N-acetylneuraminic acid synthetase